MQNRDQTKVLVDKESLDALADNIQSVSDAMRTISNTRLKNLTIVRLIKIMTNLPMRDINQVLEALSDLENEFLKPKKDIKK